jgi:kinesin family protein 2/24
MGKNKNKGIYMLAVNDIFEKLNEEQFVYISYFEIYGGKLFDLLNSRNKLVAREDHNSQVNIVGLKEKNTLNVQETLKLIEEGNNLRSIGTTGANSES